MKKKTPGFLVLFVCIACVSSAQNVGIGTTIPNKQLHIQGTGEILRIQGFQPWIGFMNNTDGDYKGFIYYPDTALVAGSAAGSNQPIVLAPNNTGLLYANATQRVGIGTSAPAERLDVNGNLNVQGNLKINGNAGNPGDVLRVNPDGTQNWFNLSGYKNQRLFQGFGVNWTVPPGVREVLVEVVGQGSGGAKGGGGGGGGYLIFTAKVAPGNIFSLNCNGFNVFGAATEFDFGSDGFTTYLSSNGINVSVNGALGAGPSNGGGGGYTYSLAVSDSITSYRFIPGCNGSITKETYQQFSATEYVTCRNQGNGGASFYNINYESQGGFFSFNSSTLINKTLIISNNFANSYGAGGAGGNTGSAWGGAAAPAAIIIHW